MSIVSHTVTTTPQSDTRMTVTYTFVDHLGGETIVTKLVPNDFDTEADALSMYAQIEYQQAENELGEAIEKIERYENPDKVTDFMDQVEFDRRLLGHIMTIRDCHMVNACLPFWSAVQPRNGNNKAQRANNLGVSTSEYDLVADRLNSTIGASSYLVNDLASVWEGILPDWN